MLLRWFLALGHIHCTVDMWRLVTNCCLTHDKIYASHKRKSYFCRENKISWKNGCRNINSFIFPLVNLVSVKKLRWERRKSTPRRSTNQRNGHTSDKRHPPCLTCRLTGTSSLTSTHCFPFFTMHSRDDLTVGAEGELVCTKAINKKWLLALLTCNHTSSAAPTLAPPPISSSSSASSSYYSCCYLRSLRKDHITCNGNAQRHCVGQSAEPVAWLSQA